MNINFHRLHLDATAFVSKQCLLEGEDIQQLNDAITRKFAELIVKECAELIDNKEMITASQTYDEVFCAVYDTKEDCAKMILANFNLYD